MIDTTVEQSKICAPSAAFILGQVSSDLKAFNKIESSDIVRSLFGIEAANPNAMDITEALVASIDAAGQMKIRALLQDRGISGVIWRFVTTKKFMIEMSKAISSHGNFLSLSLIMVNGDDGITTAVRELVRFNKDKTEFLDKRMRSIEYNTDTVDTLVNLQKEAVAALEKKYLKSEPKKEEPKAPPPPPKDICHFDVTGLESFGDQENELCAKIWDPLGKLIETGYTTAEDVLKWLNDNKPLSIEGKEFTYAVAVEPDDSTNGLYKINVTMSDAKPKTIRLSEIGKYNLDPCKWGTWDNLINAMDGDPQYETPDHGIVNVGDTYYVFLNGEYLMINNLGDRIRLDAELARMAAKAKLENEHVVLKITANFEHVNAIKRDRILHAIHTQLDNKSMDEIKANDNLFNAIHSAIVQELGEEASHTFEYHYDLDDETKELVIEEIVEETPVQESVKPAVEVTQEVTEAVKKGLDTDGDIPEPILPEEEKKKLREMGISESDIQAIEEGKVTEKEVIKLHESMEELKEEQQPEASAQAEVPAVEAPKPVETEQPYTYNIVVNGHEKVEMADRVRAFVAEGIQKVANGGAPLNIKEDVMRNFHTNVLDVRFDKKSATETDITITLQEIVEQEPKKETKPMATYKIETAENLKDIEETIKVELAKLLESGITDDYHLSEELRKITEDEHISVSYNSESNVYFVGEEAPPEEVPGADIHDRDVQEGLLRGLFGTVAPAITHIQTFLRRHLKEIQNPTYLATETFPTEVMQVWDTKPYNFTVSIVKFKDGRFYRIFLAVTNPGLTDPTWLATHDIPGRWIQLGSDIQESSFRPNFDRPRRRY